MKILRTLFLILNSALCILNSANAQQMEVNGIYDAQVPAEISIAKITGINTIDTATAICSSPNTFWGVDQQTQEIKEFDLTNNVITYTGNYIPTIPGYSLCIANNLNGGAQSPTIYTSQGNNAWYWNGGNTWAQVPGSASVILYNGAGAGNNLYFEFLGGTTEIVKYDGTTFSTIYTTNNNTGCADIAVDMAGTFIYIGLGTNGQSDSLYIISASGQILNQYSFILNVVNAYGCFLLNSVFYVGLGAGNSLSPNSIVPVTFTGTGAIIGTPIFLPPGIVLTSDLASCNPGLLEGINSVSSEQEFTLSPNPAKESLEVSTATIHSTTYAVYSIEGKMVIPASAIIGSKTNINVSHLKKGIYFVEMRNSTGVVRKKFAKM